MSLESEPATHPGLDDPNCLVRAVADAMKSEPALEAVKINRKQRSIAVATLGKPKSEDLERYLTSQIRRMEQAESGRRCTLLESDADCATCPVPMPAPDRRMVLIQRDPDTTTISRVTCPTAPRFWRWRDVAWPKLVPREVMLPDEADHEREWKEQLAAAGLCGFLWLAGFVLQQGPWGLWAYGLAYVAGGWFTVHEVWERLQKRAVDVHFLMLAVAVGSASIGAWSEGAMLLFLFSLSGALEHYAMGRTQREIRSLFKTAPKVATLLDERGGERAVPVEQLQPAMRLLIKPGEQFPVDAEIVKGRTSADESNLTGEAAPVEKNIGDTVLAGTLNQWGVVEVSVLRAAGQSALQKIIQLIQEAQHLKAPSQRFTDKFGTGYTYAALGLSALMFFVWWLGFGFSAFDSTGESRSAFYRAMTLLVVASPCALVLSIPSAILAAIAWAARRGILFRGGAAVERLAEVSVVAMDKTGTLTTGELKVERVESFPPGREHEVAELAYSLERLSTHPLARAITRYGKQQQLRSVELEHFESVPGLGLRAQSSGGDIRLGRREWLARTSAGRQPVQGPGSASDVAASFSLRSGIPGMGADAQAEACGYSLRAGNPGLAGDAAIRRCLEQVPPTDAGFSEVWLAKDGLVGRILLRDDLRPQAREVVARLRQRGLATIVLTGDRQATAENLKTQLAIDEVRAELKPEQKVEVIAAFSRQGRKVAMVGDGVNDAPSLAAAHVGVAMGARGSDAALEQAEVVLMHDRLENFLTAFDLSRRSRRIISQNLVISLGAVVVLVALALLGGIPLTVGVVGHEGSTVIVVMNSLRLLFGLPRNA